MSQSHKPETKAITSTSLADASSGAVSTPITLSTNYERQADGSYAHDYIYSRLDNPNRKLLENSLAVLEQGKSAVAYASGMAATSAVFQLLEPGDHVLLPDDAYYSTTHLFDELFHKWNLNRTAVDMSDLNAIKSALEPRTKLIWIETPSNPLLKISDIKAIAAVAKAQGALCVVDNTWATPVIQHPLTLGADIVMHSTTKYLSGHGDVIGGGLVLKESFYDEKLRIIQTVSGGVPSPFDCWLAARGIKTLYVRFKAQMDTALQLANFLEAHKGIEKVHFPGLISHPQHELVKEQMSGYGAMISVEVRGGAARALEMTGKLKLFTAATSLGGVESLVEHRKSIEGEESLTPDNLLRISVGLEHVDDLIADWAQALSA